MGEKADIRPILSTPPTPSRATLRLSSFLVDGRPVIVDDSAITMLLSDLASYLNAELRIGEIADYGSALNGLQMENSKGEVTKVIAAVDACLPVIREATARGADLLLVHHGLFWSGLQPVTRSVFEKNRLCIENNLAIYSAHLPLDAHPTLGNNAVLMRALRLEPARSFHPYKGTDIGLVAEAEVHRDELVARLKQATGAAVHLCPGGPAVTKRIGLVTGGAGSEVAAAVAAGIDTFITGEGPHWSYTLAEELGVNLIYAGHYATETFGVKALARHLNEKFGLPWEFVDHPTGL
ncbi:MAG: Nif3-like dinuclear metal center hexameric protein [Verrucomicrobiaceae bacterium]|nr:Nif3-like dinuclear metal center hexameric protein [Verrucomicrobiaceae bacterium]